MADSCFQVVDKAIPPRSFPNFKNLPLELRYKIYSFAVQPRLVSLFAYPVPVAYQDRVPGNGTRRSLEMTAHIERFFTNPGPPPSLLHTSSETRAFMHSRHFRAVESVRNPSIFDRSKMSLESLDPDRSNTYARPLIYLRAVPIEHRRFSLVDPINDVFFLEDPNISRFRFTISTIDILVRWMDVYCLQNLKRLVMPFYTWRKALMFHHISAITKFKSLEELTISFLGSEEETPSRDWVSHVGTQDNPYFEDAKKVVLSDFTELTAKFPGWKKPILKFTKSKASLLRDLGFEGAGEELTVRSTIFEIAG